MGKGARSHERERLWRQVLKKFAASGMGVRAFCRREGLSEPSFYAWRRELRLRDAEAQQAAGTKRPAAKRSKDAHRPAKQSGRTKSVSQPAALVELVPQPVAISSLIEIETPAGYTIRLQGSTDQKALAAVLGCLPGAASC